jgi:addiction module RelE/StbE family toxin
MLGSGDLDREVFQEFVQALSEHDRLPPEWNEHPLTREWTGFWDAHLADDVVVLFKRVGTEVRLVDIGRHKDFFQNYRRSAGQPEHPPGQSGRQHDQSLRDARKEKERRKGVWGHWPKQS